MSVQLTVQQVIDEILPTYKAVEIRTAALRVEETWVNLCSVIRCSANGPAEQRKLLKEAWQSLPSADGTLIHFRNLVFPARTGVTTIARMLKEGILPFKNISVNLGWTPDQSTFNGYIQSHADPESQWPCFHSTQNAVSTTQNQELFRKLSLVQHGNDLQRHLSSRSYNNIAVAVRRFLGLQPQSHFEFISAIWMWLPIFARIEEQTIQGDALRIAYTAHRKLARVIEVHATRREDRKEQILHFSQATRESGDEYHQYEVSAEVGDVEINTAIDLQLVHTSLGAIESGTHFKRDLAHRVRVNPVWTLLKRFCPTDELRKLLVNPNGFPNDNKVGTSQRQFEAHIAWLLTCFGFQTIWLGQYEDLKVQGGKAKLASLDLLAYHHDAGRLVLGACTTAAPKESDYTNLVDVRARLLDELPDSERPGTDMVLFTAAAGSPATWAVSSGSEDLIGDHVRILNAADLREAIAALEAGDVAWLLNTLGNVELGMGFSGLHS